MLRTTQVRSLLALATFCLVLLAGCSGKKPVTVKGEIANVANMKLVKDDTIQIGFDPQDKDGKSASAQASASDGSFTLQATPGKYKVSVQISPYRGSQGSQARAAQFDGYNKKYTPTDTPLTCEVATSQQSITIDLDKGTVTKK